MPNDSRGTNMVVRDPEVAASFHMSAQVNAMLRELLRARQVRGETNPQE
jgi:hypothetical protein